MSAWTDNVELHTTPHKDEYGDWRAVEDTDVAQCGTCLRKWCYTCNPTPAARCPFEYDHDETDEPAYFGEELHDDESDDLDDVLDAVREHRGDYLAMVEGLIEEVRALRSRA